MRARASQLWDEAGAAQGLVAYRARVLRLTLHAVPRMLKQCFEKCVEHFHDSELSLGENTCLDRCFPSPSPPASPGSKPRGRVGSCLRLGSTLSEAVVASARRARRTI